MTRSVVLAEDAQCDIEQATLWYERHGGPALGARFLEALAASFARLEQFPEIHIEVHPGIRRVLAPPFPYLLLYEIGEDQIVVHRCIHARRDPASWRDRHRM